MGEVSPASSEHQRGTSGKILKRPLPVLVAALALADDRVRPVGCHAPNGRKPIFFG
jgi:hypothetical protein